MVTVWFKRVCFGIAVCGLLWGCGHRTEPGVPYAVLLKQLSDPDWMATLSGPDTIVATTFDRTGGNDDFGYYLRKEGDGLVIADIQQPGVLTRFWTTGIRDHQRFQFFFDGEKTPRIDTTLAEMKTGISPFAPPLARYEQSCFWSFAPLPFYKSLKIVTEDNDFSSRKRKLYYQYNWLPLHEAPASWPRRPDVETLAALDEFAAEFERTEPSGDNLSTQSFAAEIPAGSETVITELSGPSIIRQLALTPASLTPEQLRNVVLKMYWDGSSAPSVCVPLGDFFGSVWNRTHYQSRFFELKENTFSCRFPMPFETSARIAIANESEEPLRLQAEVKVSNDWKNDLGYFHAVWNQSGPNPGTPHSILRTAGHGKYVGCILSATSFDRSWWLLESDEYMIRDGEPKPCWHGTGLEDYFNSGWYYKNVIARPLHGLVFKAPYRTVQYRLHDLDAVHFDEKMAVMIERGPGNASHGTFESTAFYYLDEPSAVTLAADRTPPVDPFAKYTLMSELANFERLNDYLGASEAIDQWLHVYGKPPDEPVLRLRQIAYIERLEGFEKAKPLYEQFIEQTESAVAKQYAEQLLWFHESPDHALLTFYTKNPARLSLDGKPMLMGGNPQHLSVKQVVLEPGRHELTLETQQSGYPDWVQACLRTHNGLISTDSTWEFTFDNTQWYFVNDVQMEGPPSAPQVAMVAHPFVDMQSKALAIWVSEAWPPTAASVLFRKEFVSP
ncbi:MAG: DUF2961 domain-containing protein [Kiritimatiellales bacterium]|nr:DUF2961 domain-containing protein [Kiritimatiellota bacterium]MBL7011626.1 DUF2961 domain-containing protein [Kiritimatiellales bacterium]